jgi:hypothetical protein
MQSTPAWCECDGDGDGLGERDGECERDGDGLGEAEREGLGLLLADGLGLLVRLGLVLTVGLLDGLADLDGLVLLDGLALVDAVELWRLAPSSLADTAETVRRPHGEFIGRAPDANAGAIAKPDARNVPAAMQTAARLVRTIPVRTVALRSSSRPAPAPSSRSPAYPTSLVGNPGRPAGAITSSISLPSDWLKWRMSLIAKLGTIIMLFRKGITNVPRVAAG